MRSVRRFGRLFAVAGAAVMAITLGAARAQDAAGRAQDVAFDELLSGVVRIKTFINPDGRTLESLGRDREGSGIVIDDNGLVLTIGYLIVEAHAAEIITNSGHAVPADIVGFDNDTGFGLLRAIAPLRVRPLVLGKSSEVKAGDPVVVAGYGGAPRALPVRVVSKREFAGYWEYLLDNAIFTSPPYPAWSGAALINREGKLVGVGSLVVGDAAEKGREGPGNMFVPIDLLLPILGDLLTTGHSTAPPRPWIGINTQDIGGHLFVTRVTPGTPADKAGLKRGDLIVGVDGKAAKGVPDFYRKMWAQGRAGVTIPLDILRGGEHQRVEVPSINRLDHLKLKSTF
jgi:S1-C subfamily serine protease